MKRAGLTKDWRAGVLALALSLTPAAADTLPPRAPWGGDVGRMAEHVAQIEARGGSVRIDGRCRSSCTMQLLVGCVTPDARLGFHRPTVTEGPSTADLWARLIAAHYPPAMAQWYLRGPAQSHRLVWLDSFGALSLGAQPCRG